MPGRVDVVIPVEAEAAIALTDARQREAVGRRFFTSMIAPKISKLETSVAGTQFCTKHRTRAVLC